ncbi:MAG: aminomethyl-transferring glycine dehydrogenase subunit GcvPB [Oscillibacter sp.]|jgi:glycine dehydrogenase subunit 2|nr:aminomethyl-transferring glycine dehydrogenase subunit GcvPB [Oscillibacter sp.]
MKLIFEKGAPDQHLSLLPACDVPEVSFKEERALPLRLPHVSENELTRHYKQLSDRVHGMNDGFYPLGSCTMKYNPKIDEELAALPGFTQIHPLQSAETAQGCLEVLHTMEKNLCEITGLDAFTLQPAAGAHGEFTGLLLIKAYHVHHKDFARTKIIVPDSAHGTNPASARMAGFDVVNIPSGPDGCVDLEALKAAVGPDTAGLMLTNPNTVGIFDKNILKITEIIHKAGGLCYYDGANLNAVLGVVRPGDMGFDACHLNLHKSFATPHGGGGPGAGPVGCKAELAQFLPGPQVEEKGGKYKFVTPKYSIGRVRGFAGNFDVVVKALCYLLTLGKEELPHVAENAVLNANYMMARLKTSYTMAYDTFCMHEFVMSLEGLHKETGIAAMDIAKGLLDHGIHPPTMYFPLIVHEALMIEPCETESKEIMDEVCDVFLQLFEEAKTNPQALHDAPLHTPVRRLDEVAAARHAIVRYNFD